MKQLLILPFDHRGSFLKGVFGISGREPTKEETARISGVKRVIFDAYRKVLAQGLVSRQDSAILVDEQFGSAILKEANDQGILTATPMEKSGQDIFDFDQGDPGFQKQIARINPTFTKVLVRLNPDDNPGDIKTQLQRLKKLNDWLKQNNRKFLFELLVPATEKQLGKVGGDNKRYEAELRPQLTVEALKKVQEAGINPDVWKLEGMETTEDVQKVARQVRSFNPDAAIIVLGRGESAEKARHWLQQAKSVKGVVGFAVGRTVFLEPVKAYVAGTISRKEAVDRIAANYASFVRLWKE